MKPAASSEAADRLPQQPTRVCWAWASAPASRPDRQALRLRTRHDGPDGDSASARATVAADESCELRRPANGRAADPLQTKQQTAGKRVASLDVVASVPADAARDDDRDSPSALFTLPLRPPAEVHATVTLILPTHPPPRVPGAGLAGSYESHADAISEQQSAIGADEPVGPTVGQFDF